MTTAEKYQLMYDTLKKLTIGFWTANVGNQFEEYNREGPWGEFATEQEAQIAADLRANTHGDSASYGYTTFVSTGIPNGKSEYEFITEILNKVKEL